MPIINRFADHVGLLNAKLGLMGLATCDRIQLVRRPLGRPHMDMVILDWLFPQLAYTLRLVVETIVPSRSEVETIVPSRSEEWVVPSRSEEWAVLNYDERIVRLDFHENGEEEVAIMLRDLATRSRRQHAILSPPLMLALGRPELPNVALQRLISPQVWPDAEFLNTYLDEY